jgi:hypothetical protein
MNAIASLSRFAKTGCGDFDGNPKRERGFSRSSFPRLRFGLPLTANWRCPASTRADVPSSLQKPGVCGMKLRLVCLVAVLLVVVSAVVSVRSDREVRQPPEASDVVLQADSSSTSTKATLVGRQVCKECHAENFELHSHHGHASTLARTAGDPDLVNKFAGRSFDAGEPYGTFTYHSDDEGRLFARLAHKFGDKPFPLQFALGSGHNGVTLVTLIPGAEGATAAIEHRVSWFSSPEGGRLGISPGHPGKTPREEVEFFGDISRGEALQKCIFCHTTKAKIVGQDIVDVVPGVNCEKCHGAGSEHVRQARADPNPPPYSVGHADWDSESEFQLCGDCHRLPIFISRSELIEYPDLLARFQPVGLLRSRCYLESEGRLRCTTCHSPHATLKQTTMAEHVQTCIECHKEESEDHVACPVSPKQGCIECHMPPLLHEEGLKFHDHWIRVRADESGDRLPSSVE